MSGIVICMFLKVNGMGSAKEAGLLALAPLCFELLAIALLLWSAALRLACEGYDSVVGVVFAAGLCLPVWLITVAGRAAYQEHNLSFATIEVFIGLLFLAELMMVVTLGIYIELVRLCRVCIVCWRMTVNRVQDRLPYRRVATDEDLSIGAIVRVREGFTSVNFVFEKGLGIRVPHDLETGQIGIVAQMVDGGAVVRFHHTWARQFVANVDMENLDVATQESDPALAATQE